MTTQAPTPKPEGAVRPPAPAAPPRPGQPEKQLYLLQVHGGPSVVVRAACVTCARSVAAGDAGAEGTAAWRDPERSTCKLIQPTGINGVVLRRESE